MSRLLALLILQDRIEHAQHLKWRIRRQPMALNTTNSFFYGAINRSNWNNRLLWLRTTNFSSLLQIERSSMCNDYIEVEINTKDLVFKD